MLAQLRAFVNAALPAGALGRELYGGIEQRGHVTGAAWIVNRDASRVVLVHHAKLNRWLQPGGHCDGETDVLNVALREAREETGLDVAPLHTNIFDVDVHPIPEYWNTPEHLHYDVRFLFGADDGIAPQLSAESHAVRWLSLEEAAALNPSPSIARMIAKTRLLQNDAKSDAFPKRDR